MNEGLLVTQPQTPIPASISPETDVSTGGADVRVKLFYRRDIERLAQRYRLQLAS